MGVLYSLAGAVAVAIAIPTFAIGLLIRRVNKLAAAIKAGQPIVAYPAPLPVTRNHPMEEEIEAAAAASFPERDEPSIGIEQAAREDDIPERPAPVGDAEAEGDEPINENRAGHLPSLAAIEHAIETPEAPAESDRPLFLGRRKLYDLLGRFDRGRDRGRRVQVQFMGDFKKYLAERRGAKG